MDVGLEIDITVYKNEKSVAFAYVRGVTQLRQNVFIESLLSVDCDRFLKFFPLISKTSGCKPCPLNFKPCM